MVTRIGVTLLLIAFFAVSDGRRNFEETFQKCEENFECVHKSVCEYFNERIGEYRRTKNKEITRELRGLICNEEKHAVCCREEGQFSISKIQTIPRPRGPQQSSCQSLDSCGKPQKIPESVKNIRKEFVYRAILPSDN